MGEKKIDVAATRRHAPSIRAEFLVSVLDHTILQRKMASAY